MNKFDDIQLSAQGRYYIYATLMRAYCGKRSAVIAGILVYYILSYTLKISFIYIICNAMYTA